MSQEPTPIDVRHVVCNLTPTILAHLDQADKEPGTRVIFQIRQGIQLEMGSAFGTLEGWTLEMASQIGHDVLCFTRQKARRDVPDLNLLDY
ncbi:hypothetical protein SAMN02745704_00200 [Paucidesulfovibrio gracilis DSM 16080]|uniref:TusA-related sulfurtransferase n=1 Tax=Paucidesulfovibrio gracilis DSM 16080 TaxID=1121449 RepID=A0A1T4W3H4_9BACT|nr:hypothetical protein [Paucidesulfovibrio gracilis]SKA71747.1 hypothetical protein SAMN02745704_00200 [Paucidesulfovibrio gracilis DSM 16080]